MDRYSEIVNMWHSFNINKVSDLDKYLYNFRILFAYNSGKLENEEINLHDTREIFENGKVLNFTGSPKTIFEQENQKKCYEVLKYKIINKAPISIELIKEIHLILTSGTYDERRYIDNGERSGEFKKHDYITGINEVGSPAEQVERDLNEIVKEVNSYDSNNFINVAAYLHANFEYIHPFADGNGRVGRTLSNYYLLINSSPPAIIYDDDKELYYECLEKFDIHEDLEPLIKFFKYETEKTWNKTLGIFSKNIIDL